MTKRRQLYAPPQRNTKSPSFALPVESRPVLQGPLQDHQAPLQAHQAAVGSPAHQQAQYAATPPWGSFAPVVPHVRLAVVVPHVSALQQMSWCRIDENIPSEMDVQSVDWLEVRLL